MVAALRTARDLFLRRDAPMSSWFISNVLYFECGQDGWLRKCVHLSVGLKILKSLSVGLKTLKSV